jgi:predicted amidophosphoribosyltransferase
MAVAIRSAYCKRIMEQRFNRGLCPNCGYDIRASKDRCPECGFEITP